MQGNEEFLYRKTSYWGFSFDNLELGAQETPHYVLRNTKIHDNAVSLDLSTCFQPGLDLELSTQSLHGFNLGEATCATEMRSKFDSSYQPRDYTALDLICHKDLPKDLPSGIA